MSKKLLSLILSLCLVMPGIPVFGINLLALPAFNENLIQEISFDESKWDVFVPERYAAKLELDGSLIAYRFPSGRFFAPAFQSWVSRKVNFTKEKSLTGIIHFSNAVST